MSEPVNLNETSDAREWARVFVAHVISNPGIAMDEATMTTWFASALLRGFDERGNDIARLADVKDDLLAACKGIDEFQRAYQRNTLDTAPGNYVWASKLMEVVAQARAAIQKAEAK